MKRPSLFQHPHQNSLDSSLIYKDTKTCSALDKNVTISQNEKENRKNTGAMRKISAAPSLFLGDTNAEPLFVWRLVNM